jgi:hypothetical protein
LCGSGQYLGQGRLASAVLPQQGGDLSVPQREGDPFQDALPPVLLDESIDRQGRPLGLHGILQLAVQSNIDPDIAPIYVEMD